jgi:hypothetical protein
MRSTDCMLTKQTMGRVRRRTSTKQRSMMLVVRSLRHRCRGKRKTASCQGRSKRGSSAYLVILPRRPSFGKNRLKLWGFLRYVRWDSELWFQMPEKCYCMN